MSAQPARAKIIRTRSLNVIAEWVKGQPIYADIEIPYEDLSPGPRGYRVFVVDYDASARTLSPSVTVPIPKEERTPGNPALHAENVYAIVMRTLGNFEFALGRNVGWSFGGHQIYVAPHAFRDANAYYSREHRGLFFGYYREDQRDRFMCLSHDVVAHETTHALLDGLRLGYYYSSQPDQAAFHEGFADIVALLSMFSLQEVTRTLLCEYYSLPTSGGMIQCKKLNAPNLRETALLGLGENFGERGDALRRSVDLKPDKKILDKPRYQEAHDRGEVLVAAVMNSFLEIWLKRIKGLGGTGTTALQSSSVAEEGSKSAEQLLTMCIRALDYSPCASISFSDFLSALLTADFEVQNNDKRYGYRDVLRESFASYGIHLNTTHGREENLWLPPSHPLDFRNTHFEALQHDRDAMFRFIWQNRRQLKVSEDAYVEVRSLRPCVRVSWDGFVVRETVAEYVEMLTLTAGELKKYGIRKPRHLENDRQVMLFGGGVLIFDEYGAVKYHIKQELLDPRRQETFIEYLFKAGQYDLKSRDKGFANLHRARLLGFPRLTGGGYEYF